MQSVIKTPANIVGLPDDPIFASVRNLIVYPNPASKLINLAMENKINQYIRMEGYSWNLVDQRGVEVKRGLLQEDFSSPQQIEIDQLANGMYLMRISKGNRIVFIRKIAVMNQR